MHINSMKGKRVLMSSSVLCGPGTSPKSEASPLVIEREGANIREVVGTPWHQRETSLWVPLQLSVSDLLLKAEPA